MNQSFREFEFFIFNDGSTDASASIIASYNDPRIRFHNSDVNKGYLHWLNAGIAGARGKYIVRMDADDCSEPHRLAEQVRFMEKNPEVAIAGSAVTIFGSDKPDRPFEVAVDETVIRWGLLFNNMLIHPSVIMRRDALVEKGLLYQSEFYGSEDYRLWTDAIMSGLTVRNIDQFLLRYRIHGESYTHKNRDRQKRNSKKIAADYIRFLLPEVTEQEAELFAASMYSGNLKKIQEEYKKLKQIIPAEQFRLVVPSFRDKVLTLFYESSDNRLVDVFRFIASLSVMPGIFYTDGKRIRLLKHYIKRKIKLI